MSQFVKPINPGRFNKRVDIYSYGEIDTDLGATRTVLIKNCTVWAWLHPTRGTEFLEYYRDANALQYKVTMRYRSGLTEKDVLVFDGRQFEINSIINIEEGNTYLEVYCTESKDRQVLYG